MQQVFSEFFVLRNRFRNRAGITGFSCLNALLFAAPAKLNHAALRHAPIRNVVRNGRIDNGASTWS